MPVKALSFKGDKKVKKRKRTDATDDSNPNTTRNPQKSNPDPDDETTWLIPAQASDLLGPTIIVLPTKPPTCLASDPDGTVFASPLENVIEDDPRTAEPHSVQQVWVTTRVAGMKGSQVTFKAAHGGYLSCDVHGTLGAKREARGHEETFTIETTTDENTGRISHLLQTAATLSPGTSKEEKRYLGAKSDITSSEQSNSKKLAISLRGDAPSFTSAESDSQTATPTTLILKMQSRFLPQTAETRASAQSKEKVTRQDLERAAGRALTDEQVKRLKRAKREGGFHEEILDVRAKGKHDKYA